MAEADETPRSTPQQVHDRQLAHEQRVREVLLKLEAVSDLAADLPRLMEMAGSSGELVHMVAVLIVQLGACSRKAAADVRYARARTARTKEELREALPQRDAHG